MARMLEYKKIIKPLLVVSYLTLLFFVGVAINFYYKYYSVRELPGSGELMEGAAYAILIAFWPTLICVCLAFFFKKHLSKNEFYWSLSTIPIWVLAIGIKWLVVT